MLILQNAVAKGAVSYTHLDVYKRQHVFKLKDDKVVKVPVTLGQGQGEWLQVDGDLRPDEQLVVRGAETLNDGDVVKVLSATEFKLAQQH